MQASFKFFRSSRAAKLLGTLCLLSGALSGVFHNAHAADVSWATYGANASGALVPAIIGAPDGVMAPYAWDAAKFTERRSYASMATTMGLGEAQLNSFNVLAWEGNAGAPAASGGWESARWVFSDGLGGSVSSTFNELTGGSSNPAVIFKTGSISGAAYNSLFGSSVPAGEVWSWLLVSLPATVNTRSPGFRVDFVPVGGGIGLGEGTPDPDAIGVLSAVPEPGSWALMGVGLLALLGWQRRSVRRRLTRPRLGASSVLAPALAPALALGLALTQAPAMATVVIDDFSSGGFIRTQGPLGFGTTGVDINSGSMAGGQRYTAFETDAALTGSTALSKVSVTTGDQRFTMQTGEGIAQRTSVLYGFGAAGLAPLALDLSGEDRIRINFAYNTAQLNFNILLYNGSAPYTQIGLNILANPNPFSVDFVFADGIYPSGPIDFSHIDLIYLQTQSTEYGQSFALTSITAVPEPASWLMLGSGALLLAARRLRAARG